MVSGAICLPVLFPPAIAYIAEDKKRHGRQVKDAPVQRLGRAFAHLLCGTGTDRTLRLDGRRCVQGKQEDEYD